MARALNVPTNVRRYGGAARYDRLSVYDGATKSAEVMTGTDPSSGSELVSMQQMGDAMSCSSFPPLAAAATFSTDGCPRNTMVSTSNQMLVRFHSSNVLVPPHRSVRPTSGLDAGGRAVVRTGFSAKWRFIEVGLCGEDQPDWQPTPGVGSQDTCASFRASKGTPGCSQQSPAANVPSGALSYIIVCFHHPPCAQVSDSNCCSAMASCSLDVQGNEMEFSVLAQQACPATCGLCAGCSRAAGEIEARLLEMGSSIDCLLPAR